MPGPRIRRVLMTFFLLTVNKRECPERRPVRVPAPRMRSGGREGERPDPEHRKKKRRRRRALIYRPSPDNLPVESPRLPRADLGVDASDTASPGLGGHERHRLHLVCSPLERQCKKVLAVELKDISQEMEILHSRFPDRCEIPSSSSSCTRRVVPSSCCPSAYSVNEACVLRSGESLAGKPDMESSPPALLTPCSYLAPLPDLDPHSSLPVPPSSPKTSGWSLVPLLNRMRSKLESFAEIFITPIKNCGNTGNEKEIQTSSDSEVKRSNGTEREVDGIRSQESQVLEGHLWESCTPSADCKSSEQVADAASLTTVPVTPSPGYQEEMCSRDSDDLLQRPDGRGLGEMSRDPFTTPPSNTELNLQIAVTHPLSALCRSPLQRCFSCPSLPLTAPSSAPTRLGVPGGSSELVCHPCTPCNVTHPHRRRHSVGTLEESKEMPPSIFSLSCLKKEKHPHLLCHSSSAGVCYQQEPFGKCPALGSLFGDLSSWSPCVNRKTRRQQIFQSQMEQITGCGSETKQENHLPACVKKVSDFQIRKRPLRQQENLTPLGLPKRARLQKEEFSLEEIYTNKNYRTPTEKRTFETIFEEPVMRGGSLVLTSQRPLKRIIVFQDCSVRPRKRRKKGRCAVSGHRRKAASTEKKLELESLLEHKLAQLEAALRGEEDTHVS